MKTLVALVGTKYRGAEMLALLAALPQGEPLELRREAGNKYDANAVQVWARGYLIGYVPKTQNRELAIAMDAAITRRPLIDESRVFPGKLAIDGGKQPLIEIDEEDLK